jgi:hypothetical protein
MRIFTTKPIKNIFCKRYCLLTLLILPSGIWILFHKGDRIFHISKEIDPRFKEILIALGDSSLNNGDFPVKAILIYNDNIIGKGYNIVFRDDDQTGHAEINCIREAYNSW